MPGAFETDVTKAWDMEAFAQVARSFPLQRIGQPDEIVGTALYLASDAVELHDRQRDRRRRRRRLARRSL